MTKAGRGFNYFAVAGLLFAVSMLSACSSGDVSNSNSSNSTVTASRNANAGASETKNKDTSPVTITISDLFAEAKTTSASSMMQTYSGRQMTVTGGVLYEFKVDMLMVGNGQNPDFGTESSAPQYYVTCKGSSSGYSADVEDRVASQLKAGKAEAATVKGVFKEYGSYNNKHWVILDQCAVVKP